MRPLKPYRCALWIWYRGTGFAGYQTQPRRRTVQSELQRALVAAGVRANPACAGRTDRGVHARMQVISVRVPREISPAALEAHLRGTLPADLGVERARAVDRSFHAQWSATQKEYRYRLDLSAKPENPISSASVWAPSQEPRLNGAPLDPRGLVEALALYEGEHDFGAFHESSSPRRLRQIFRASAKPRGEIWEVTLRGSAFGRHMARYMVGAAVLAAGGVVSCEAIRDAVSSGKPIPGLRAPPSGLVLWEVAYPPEMDPFPEADRRSTSSIPAGLPF